MNTYEIYKELFVIYNKIDKCNYLNKNNIQNNKNDIDKIEFLDLLNDALDIKFKDKILYDFLIYLYKTNSKGFMKYLTNDITNLHAFILWLEPIEISKHFNII